MLPALVSDDRPVIAEIGVARQFRGRGHVRDLLGHGTRVLAEVGTTQIRADTDLVNTPMRAAFGRAGYREFAQRFDFRWGTNQDRQG